MTSKHNNSVKRAARWRRRACAVLLVFLLSIGMSGGDSLSIYDKIVAGARPCIVEGQCSIAGGVKGCRCPVAVRAGAKGQVDAAARKASCPQTERLYCPPLENPRCENQVCVAKENDE
jgi:hypothetical protein